jgi:hypothetical protein
MESLLELPEQVSEWVEGAGTDAGVELASPPESVLVTATAIAAGVATRRGLKACWKRLRGTAPPDNPTAAGVTWVDALTWAAAVGAAVGIARVMGRRGASVAARKWAAHRR